MLLLDIFLSFPNSDSGRLFSDTVIRKSLAKALVNALNEVNLRLIDRDQPLIIEP